LRHFKSFEFWKTLLVIQKKTIWLELLHPRFSFKKRVWKYFISKTPKVESGFRFENPLCFEQKKMFSFAIQSLILKTLWKWFKNVFQWVVWKRQIKKINLCCLISNFTGKVFKMLWRYFTKVWKAWFKGLHPFAFG